MKCLEIVVLWSTFNQRCRKVRKLHKKKLKSFAETRGKGKKLFTGQK